MFRRALLFAALILSPFVYAQDGVVRPNEALILENIPPVPAAIAERAEPYTEYRSAFMWSWHPQRREILIGTRFGDTVQLHEVAMPGGARTQVTFFADRVMDASYQPHKGEYFLFRKDVGGGEWYQIFRFDVGSGSTTLLTDGKSRNTDFAWSNRGDRIAYASTRRNNADLDFYVMNPQDKASDKMIAENQGGGWQMRDWSPDDRNLLAENYVSVNDSSLWMFDAATGQRTELTPKGEEKVFYSAVGFSRDGKGVYLITDKDNEYLRLGYMDVKAKSLRYLTNFKWDIDNAQLSWTAATWQLTVNENGLSTLHVIDTQSGKEVGMPKLPTGTINELCWHENNRDLAFSLNSSQSPSDVYSVDIQSRKVERWTRSETGGINPQSFVEPKLITWKSFDGREISGWLYTPKTKPPAGKYPVEIVIHGGPESQSRPSFLGRGNYLVNEMGVALIYPNVRGSTGYGKSFSELDNGFKREDTYKDIGALLDWIATQTELDSNT